MAIIAIGLLAAFIIQRGKQNVLASQTANDFTAQSIPLAQLSSSGAITVNGRTLSVNGQLRANGSLIMAPAAQPSLPATGELYYDQTSNHLKYYNGTDFVQIQTDKDASGSTTNSTTVNNNTTNLSVINNTVTTSSPLGGTVGKIAKFTSGQTLGDSILTDSNTFLSVEGGINIAAESTASDLSLFAANSAPQAFDQTDTANGTDVELGVKFQVDVSGVVKAIRFYKGAAQVGTFQGHLWTSTGTLLGTATFTVSSSGWQQANFSSPIPVSPDQTYIASYHESVTTPGTALGYAFDQGVFSANGVDNGPLHGLASGVDGGNGVFKYTTPAVLPDRTFNSTSYWVDVVFNGAIPTTDSRIRFNGAQISSSDLANDNNLAKRGSSQVFSAHNIFRNTADVVEEFNIQKADTTPLFTVDSVDSRIYLGKPGGSDNTTILVLGRKTDISDPLGTEGSIYYNDVSKMFRCYSGGAWQNCADINTPYGFSQYDEFMGGQTTSLSSDAIGSLGWHAEAIGANGSLSFNPATPAPTADRPGVLALQTPALANQGTTLMLGNASGGSMIIRRGNQFKASVAVGALTNQVLRIGLHNETSSTTQPVSGVWWEANPAVNANWRYCYGDGATATCAATTTAIAANTWMHLEAVVASTGAGTSSVQFTINNSSFAVANVTVDTTNQVSPAYSCYTTNASAQNCYWDYFQLSGATSSQR